MILQLGEKLDLPLTECSGFTQETPFLKSIGNFQNYTTSRLLEAYYLCTSIGKRIMKVCGIILLPYLLFFNAYTEQKH